jgi:hypothetical protein
MRLTSLRPSPAMVVALFALTVGAAGGAAAAAGDGGEIQGCVSRDGTIKLITAGNPACEAVQTPISWNQQGPKGDPGAAAGSSEAAQAIDLFQAKDPPKAFVRKPSGLGAKLVHKLSSPGAASTDAYATFRDGPFEVNDLFEFTGGPDFAQTIPPTVVAKLALPAGRWVIAAKALGSAKGPNQLFPDAAGMLACELVAGADYDVSGAQGAAMFSTVVHRFTKPGAVELRCNGFQTLASWVKITAIRVASLTNKPYP